MANFRGCPMRACLVAAVSAAGLLAAPALPVKPLRPGFPVGQEVPLMWEHRATGARAGQDGSLKCTYMYQPTVVVYCRDLDPAVVRLIKRLDEATAKRATHPPRPYRERLGSYAVLVADSKERATELKALAEREKIGHTVLALVVAEDTPALRDRLGEARTTVLLTGPRHVVKTAYAFRRGELTDKAIDRILADLPTILPKED